MNPSSWAQLRQAVRPEGQRDFYARRRELDLFAQFVEETPKNERIPMLLHAYERYRHFSVSGNSPEDAPFELSCWSILISTILSAKIQPKQREACEILMKSYHRCGHGSDVEPPLSLAEQAFRNCPYSLELFDSVIAYRKTLRVSRSTHSQNVKLKLAWVLWHDPRRIEKTCHTRQLQQTIHTMEPERAFHWQWLLRNFASGMQPKPSQNWLIEGKKRLAAIGEEKFLSVLDDCLTFPIGEAGLSSAGSQMLRLLVWYCCLADTGRSVPIAARLARVVWKKDAPVGKVIGALAWLLRVHGGLGFKAEARILIEKWGDISAEVRKLEPLG